MDGVAATCQALPWEPHILLSDLTAALELLHQPWELPQGMYAARGAGHGAAASGAGSGFETWLGLSSSLGLCSLTSLDMLFNSSQLRSPYL